MDLQFPRLVYRGPADATAETQHVEDADALARARRDGWRLTRRLEGAAPPSPDRGPDRPRADVSPTSPTEPPPPPAAGRAAPADRGPGTGAPPRKHTRKAKP